MINFGEGFLFTVKIYKALFEWSFLYCFEEYNIQLGIYIYVIYDKSRVSDSLCVLVEFQFDVADS